MTFYNGTTTGRSSSNPYPVGARVRVSGGTFEGDRATVLDDDGGPHVMLCVDGRVRRGRFSRTRVEPLDVVSELGDLAGD